MATHTTYLNPEFNLLETSASTLFKEAKVLEYFDLSHLLVIVPTSHSISKLKDKLVSKAKDENKSLLLPKIVTPQYFFSITDRTTVANETQRMIFLAEAIEEEFVSLNTLYPQGLKIDKDFLWFLDKAKPIMNLMDSLATIGLNINTFIEKYKNILGEDISRFEELSLIENRYFNILKNNNLEDSNAKKICTALNPSVDEGIEKIIFITISDPIALIKNTIDILSSKYDVEIWINCHEKDKDGFDKYGIPLYSFWLNRNFEIENFAHRTIIVQSPLELSKNLIKIINSKMVNKQDELNVEDLLIIMADKNFESPLKTSFSNYGITVYNPDGESIKSNIICITLIDILKFAVHQDYQTFAQLVRNSIFLQYIEDRIGVIKHSDFFISLDLLQNDHIPISFDDVKKSISYKKNKEIFSKLSEVISLVSKIADEIKDDNLSLLSLIKEIFTSLTNSKTLTNCSTLSPIFIEISEIYTEITAALNSNKYGKNLFYILTLLEEKISNLKTYQKSENFDVELLGFMELQWCEIKPLTFILPMNEGIIPSEIKTDFFLNEKIREELNIHSNNTRYARDAYIFDALMKNQNSKDINFIILKTNQDGECLKPSRLLLQRNDSESFIEAVKHLYNSIPIDYEGVAKNNNEEFPVKLFIPNKTIEENKIYVTDFKSYISCPFRFYIKRVLGYKDECDDLVTDIEPIQIGNICHNVLKKMTHCLNPDIMIEDSLRYLDVLIEKEFSTYSKSIPVEFAFYSIKQRLSAAIKIMANELATSGFNILETEKPFSIKIDSQKLSQWIGAEVKINTQFEIVGRIDRIDIKNDKSQIRIIDYKTGQLDGARKEHIKGFRTESKIYNELPNLKEKWIDLQLPLYLIALDENKALKDTSKTAAYISIPSATSKIKIDEWAITNEELASAKKCAGTIIFKIVNSEFWPPSKTVKYDSYEKILYHEDFEKYLYWDDKKNES